MRHLNEPQRIDLSAHALEELVILAGNYPVPGWDFVDWPYSGMDFSAHFVGPRLRQLSKSIRRKLLVHGFVVVGTTALLDTLPAVTSAAATTLLLSTLGFPLRVFLSHPHWRQLGVDLNRSPDKSGGAGYSPLHMDFVNAENPPDLVCLFCLRPDPMGGGETLIAQIDGIEQLLDPEDVKVLSRSQFRDGEVYNLNGVGQDMNPFPVLSLGSSWEYRFTANLLRSAPNEQARIALEAVTSILASTAVGFTLARGDLLILDQHRATHGRGAMGEGQEAISERERRLLLHSFVRQQVIRCDSTKSIID